MTTHAKPQTQLILLGTGTPNLEPERFQASLVIIAPSSIPHQPSRAYVVDCGGGTLQRLRQAQQLHPDEALSLASLDRLFLTHLHPDHTTGLPDFFIAPWVEGRQTPIEMIAPVGTIALTNALLDAYAVGIGEHQHGLATIKGAPSVIVRELPQTPVGTCFESIYADDRVTVDALRVTHGNLVAFAYRFQTADARIVVSGDTGYLPEMGDFARGADVLVHEVYCARTLANRPSQWQTYHQTVHTSTYQLGAIIQQARPRQLVLTHQLLWGATHAELIAEIKSACPDYAGTITSAHDLMHIALA